jgi:hypothetical protein
MADRTAAAHSQVVRQDAANRQMIPREALGALESSADPHD